MHAAVRQTCRLFHMNITRYQSGFIPRAVEFGRTLAVAKHRQTRRSKRGSIRSALKTGDGLALAEDEISQLTWP